MKRRTYRPNAGSITLYHGTTLQNAVGIKKHGMHSGRYGKTNWGNTTYNMTATNRRWSYNGMGAVVKIKIPTKEARKLVLRGRNESMKQAQNSIFTGGGRHAKAKRANMHPFAKTRGDFRHIQNFGLRQEIPSKYIKQIVRTAKKSSLRSNAKNYNPDLTMPRKYYGKRYKTFRGMKGY
jgi:hypothetical protein